MEGYFVTYLMSAPQGHEKQRLKNSHRPKKLKEKWWLSGEIHIKSVVWLITLLQKWFLVLIKVPWQYNSSTLGNRRRDIQEISELILQLSCNSTIILSLINILNLLSNDNKIYPIIFCMIRETKKTLRMTTRILP